MDSNAKCITLYNVLNIPYTASIELHPDFAGVSLIDDESQQVNAQREGDRHIIQYTLPPNSYVVLHKQGYGIPSAEIAQDRVLENALIRYEFSPEGQILRAFDKEIGREGSSLGIS